jgi:hypothetical protein
VRAEAEREHDERIGGCEIAARGGADVVRGEGQGEPDRDEWEQDGEGESDATPQAAKQVGKRQRREQNE